MDFHILLQLLAGQKASTHLRFHQVINGIISAEVIHKLFSWSITGGGVKGDGWGWGEKKNEKRQQSRTEVLISLALINPPGCH